MGGAGHESCVLKRSGPKVIGKVHHDRRGCASDYDPLECIVLRLVDFHVGQPGRNVNEVALMRDRVEFTALSPLHKALPFEYICNGLLLSVMVNAGFGSRPARRGARPTGGSRPGGRAQARPDAPSLASGPSGCRTAQVRRREWGET